MKSQLALSIEPYRGEPNIDRLRAVVRGQPTDRVPNFEILIEDQHVERLLGRKAGNTLGVGGDPAKGNAASEGTRPMYPHDYLEICRLIGQDAVALENFWTPLKHMRPDGAIGPITDRSITKRADAKHIIWPGEEDLEERMRYVREYVAAAKGTGVGVMLAGFCVFQTLYEFVIGLHDAMIMIMEDRDFFNELMARSTDYFVELARRAIQAGVDAFYIADDFAFNSASLCGHKSLKAFGGRILSEYSLRSTKPRFPSFSIRTAKSTTPWTCSSTWAFNASRQWIPPASTTETIKSGMGAGSLCWATLT